MKIINSEDMNKNNIFSCFSPPLTKFLVEIKGIHFIDIRFNEYTNKKCWIFAMSDSLKDALFEWKERGISGNKMY